MGVRPLALTVALVACGGEQAVEPCPAAPVPGPEPFVDVTAARGVSFRHHLATDFCKLTDTIGGPGVCTFDADGDGRIDIYFVDRSGHPNALYRNEGEHFRDIAAASHVDLPAVDAMGCLAFDYDGDGDSDLLVTANGPNQLLRNDGGTFTDVSAASGIAAAAGFSISAAAGDIDGDGDLDLFVARVVKLATCPNECKLFPIACEAERNLLYLNNGGTFSEESVARGLVEAEPTLATLMFDFDRDGDLDIYAGNDMGIKFPDRLYLNDGTGHFHDEAPKFGLSAKGTDTMGVDAGDYDNDGRTDLVITDFKDRPIRLFHCYNPALPCSNDVVPDSLDFVKWGVGFADVDQDSHIDLLVATGDVANLSGSRTQLFFRRYGEFVERLPKTKSALGLATVSRGMAFADLDGDGDLDAVIANAGSAAQLLENRGAGGHSLIVALDSRAAGAIVTATTASSSLSEHVLIGGSYAGSSDPRVHFGLGDACRADVDVRYLDGTTAKLTGASGTVAIKR